MDVENWANLIISFDDGSRGNIIVSDVGLGGLNTRVTAFMTDGVPGRQRCVAMGDGDVEITARHR